MDRLGVCLQGAELTWIHVALTGEAARAYAHVALMSRSQGWNTLTRGGCSQGG